MISTYWNGEVTQVMERGKQIGFVEGRILYMFGADGYSERFKELSESSEITGAVREWKFEQQKKDAPILHGTNHGDRLIGILMAHLAIHEPDADCIKDAKRYLTARGAD